MQMLNMTTEANNPSSPKGAPGEMSASAQDT